MTFNEFKALALNPPIYDKGKIYRMEVFGYYDEWVNDDGVYGLVIAHTSYHLTIEQARTFMLQVYKNVSEEGLKIFCSLVYEIPTGIDMRFEKYSRVFSFDAVGGLIDQTLCAYPCGINEEKYETFRGRDQSMIRFKPGDIVEVMTLWCEGRQPSVETAIITKTPPTIKDSWELYEQLGESFVDGIESDEYGFLIGEHWLAGYNSTAPSFLIFKPHVPVSEQRQKELVEYYRNYTGQAYWRQGGSRLDEIAQSTGGLSPHSSPGFISLTPSDFNPIYEADEVVHVFETVDFDTENPIETMLACIDKRTNNILSSFSNFIICISNTNWPGKRLNPKRIFEWKKIIEERLPNPKKVVWGERIMEGAMYYKIDIVAYK